MGHPAGCLWSSGRKGNSVLRLRSGLRPFRLSRQPFGRVVSHFWPNYGQKWGPWRGVCGGPGERQFSLRLRSGLRPSGFRQPSAERYRTSGQNTARNGPHGGVFVVDRANGNSVLRLRSEVRPSGFHDSLRQSGIAFLAKILPEMGHPAGCLWWTGRTAIRSFDFAQDYALRASDSLRQSGIPLIACRDEWASRAELGVAQFDIPPSLQEGNSIVTPFATLWVHSGLRQSGTQASRSAMNGAADFGGHPELWQRPRFVLCRGTRWRSLPQISGTTLRCM